MLVTEQERAIRAIREAEKNLTKQESMKSQIEKFESQLMVKERKITELTQSVETQLTLQVKAEKEIH